jgi:membrane-associated protein
MADVNLTELLLNAMTAYGPGVLGSALLLGGVGVPIPGTLLVLAAGALARQGVIDWSLALAAGLLGVVLGDNISYAMGRFAKVWIQRRGQQSSSATWRTAQARFEQGGALAIYSTRFLLTPLAIPTNLLAGGSNYDFRRFLTFDVAGEVTWLLLYGALGYAFASQWQVVSQFMDDFSSWMVGAVVVGIAVYFLMGRLRQGKSSHSDTSHLLQKFSTKPPQLCRILVRSTSSGKARFDIWRFKFDTGVVWRRLCHRSTGQPNASWS